MLNYFIWKGLNSLEQGIHCSNPASTIPSKNTEKIIIPGKSGFMTIDNNSHHYITKTLECRLIDRSRMDTIIEWLSGSGKIIFSDEPDRYYNALINRAVPIQYLLDRYRAFVLNFDAQPFKYNVSEQNDRLEIEKSPLKFNGKGSAESEPVITVYGSGNISLNINGEIISLSKVSGHVTINSEIMDAYKGNENMNPNMSGKFPTLLSNGQENIIIYTGNVSKIEIIPNWRWL